MDQGCFSALPRKISPFAISVPGRCAWYPQNNATARRRWLPTNRFTSKIREEAERACRIGGEYFFLHDRHRADRPAGHERGDALAAKLASLGASAFVSGG